MAGRRTRPHSAAPGRPGAWNGKSRRPLCSDDLSSFWTTVGSVPSAALAPATLSAEEIQRIVEEASSGEACPALPRRQRAPKKKCAADLLLPSSSAALVVRRRPRSALQWRGKAGAWKEGAGAGASAGAGAGASAGAARSAWGDGGGGQPPRSRAQAEREPEPELVAALPALVLLERVEAAVARGAAAAPGRVGTLLALMAALDARVKKHDDDATRERRAAAAVAAIKIEGRGSCDLSLAATRLLAPLAAGDPRAKLLFATQGGIGAVLAALRWHLPRSSPESLALAQLGFTVIANALCALPSARALAMRAGIVRTAAGVLSNQGLDSTTATAALNVLANIVVNDVVAKLEVARRALPSALALLGLNATRDVQGAGLRLLHNITVGTDDAEDGGGTRRLLVLILDSGVVPRLLATLRAERSKLRALRRALAALANLVDQSALFQVAVLEQGGEAAVVAVASRITSAFTKNLVNQRRTLSIDGLSVLSGSFRVLAGMASCTAVSAAEQVVLCCMSLRLLAQRLASKDDGAGGGSDGGDDAVAWEDLSLAELEMGAAAMQLVREHVSTEHADDSQLAAASATERVLRAQGARKALVAAEGGVEAILVLSRAAAARLGGLEDKVAAAVVGVSASIIKMTALEPSCVGRLHYLGALAAVASATRSLRAAPSTAAHVVTAEVTAEAKRVLCKFRLAGVDKTAVRPLSTIPIKGVAQPKRRSRALRERLGAAKPRSTRTM